MQVLNANYPVTDLSVSTDSGNSWRSTERKNYNYFERPGSDGFEKDRVYVKIRCSNGNQVILPDVPMTSELVTKAPVNC